MSQEIHDHLTWLGYLQPDGLVVSPAALVDTGILFDRNSRPLHQEFLNHLRDEQAWDEKTDPAIRNLSAFLKNFLGWPDEAFVAADDQPDTLSIVLPEYQETLRATWAIRNLHGTEPAFRLLVHELTPGQDFDAPVSEHARGWHATPTRRFERLLRETRVGLGLLSNGEALRLLYAPPGENPGSLTFKISEMSQIAGRPILGGFHLLFEQFRLFTAPEKETLTALLKRSRDFQANVSIALSHQVLEALFELARGFQAADDRAHGTLLAETWQRDPQEIYGGLISSLLRLVFLLYAEDRGLMPSGELYLQNYSVQGLYDQLRADAERYPDTMDQRFGAWARLLALFRAVHRGSRHPEMKLPARQGHLFDPERFKFLEGRGQMSGIRGQESENENEPATDSSDLRPSTLRPSDSSLPLLSDGTLHRILELLLYLDGERLSYRTLDVEQIGSVYETIMGFEVQKATGRSIALKPKKTHGAPVHLDLDALLVAKPADREKTLLDDADTKLPDAAAKALKAATTLDDLLAALDKRIDRRATPHPVPAGSIILQPTDERRRSGSHYTPRSFTEPIVRKTLEPILDRLGRHPRPEAILALKICDLAIGSGAFQVETCRQLADELVASWHYHKCLPVIPPDEDELLYARRLVAQRCLYGVDRNPMAVDLAKLSLWLATMAKDHPFTFLDHAIKCGDSLVGLTNKEIAAFHWDPTQAKQLIMGQTEMEKLMARVATERKRILDWTEDSEAAVLKKRDFLAAADAAAASLKTTGDLIIAAFFAGENPKERQQKRDEFLHRHLELQKGENIAQNLPWQLHTLNRLKGISSSSSSSSPNSKSNIQNSKSSPPIRSFHWEIEFPEVFSRKNPGFDAFVGNPPFLGGNKISEYFVGPEYGHWLKSEISESKGQVDLCVFFFCRTFALLRDDGTMGLIATSGLAEGDSRVAGLGAITARGGRIYAAKNAVPWPGTAAVLVCQIHIYKGNSQGITCQLNLTICDHINSRLQPRQELPNAVPLTSNSGWCFKGTSPGGDGFVLSLEEVKSLVEKDQRNAVVIKPLVGGDEVTAAPRDQANRRIITFGKMSLQEAEQWPAVLDIVRERILPQRLKGKNHGPGLHGRKYWWQHVLRADPLYRAIESINQCLVISEVSTHHAVRFDNTSSIFLKTVYVFAWDSFCAFSILQSRLHEIWSREHSSKLGAASRYSVSNAFETFPFPEDWETNAALEEVGRTYYEYRAALMVRNNEGLTKTYNRFHDPEETKKNSPDIHQLRELHASMDRAVLDAYGWTDIPTACEFLLDYEEEDSEDEAIETAGKKKRQKKKPWRYRWPDEVRDEVLAKLLALNAECAEQERLAGSGKKPSKTITTTRTGALKQSAMQRPKAEDELL